MKESLNVEIEEDIYYELIRLHNFILELYEFFMVFESN